MLWKISKYCIILPMDLFTLFTEVDGFPNLEQLITAVFQFSAYKWFSNFQLSSVSTGRTQTYANSVSSTTRDQKLQRDSWYYCSKTPAATTLSLASAELNSRNSCRRFILSGSACLRRKAIKMSGTFHSPTEPKIHTKDVSNLPQIPPNSKISCRIQT